MHAGVEAGIPFCAIARLVLMAEIDDWVASYTIILDNDVKGDVGCTQRCRSDKKLLYPCSLFRGQDTAYSEHKNITGKKNI